MVKRAASRRKAASMQQVMLSAPKAVVHLRAQHRRSRLGLIFGSGASKDLGFPDWPELVNRIGRDESVGAAKILARLMKKKPKAAPKSLASITHILFDHFRLRQMHKRGLSGSLTFLDEQQIKSDWLKAIHRQLYQGVNAKRRKKTIEDHPYLTAFRDIIKRSPLTVNYNFDDTLEKLLIHSRTEDEEIRTRGYEVTDKPNAQFQNDSSVVYHPNGYLPSSFADGASAEVVFSSDAFQDQLISAANGKYLHLSNHLFRNTCLLIGLSLDDTTLQSLLRQNAVTNPGHVHYIVHFLPKKDELDEVTRQEIFRTNFTSYNLYTLFLTADGIRTLANLVSMPEGSFQLQFPNVTRKFVYYVVGSIGAGKTTAASNFRNLITYDEWIDERLPELAKPQKQVARNKIGPMDKWIAEQFRKKNFALRGAREGVHIVDRCPLDPLTFPGSRSTKATRLLKKITEGGTFSIEKGHVIYLDCELTDLRVRNSFKHKYWEDAELNDLVKSIGEVYGIVSRSVICTRGRDANDVAREIAKVVFLGDYSPVDVEATLQSFAEAKS